MKQWKNIAILLVGVTVPYILSGVSDVSALATKQVLPPRVTVLSSQIITVTAVVPPHRDIVIDSHGNILEITSNTKDDVTPDVYLNDAGAEQNKRSLSPELYNQYRKIVPVGTASYGVLYKQTMPLTVTGTMSSSISSILNQKS